MPNLLNPYPKNLVDYHEPTGQKLAVIGPQGVLFTMSHLKETFLVSSSLVKGTSTLPTDRIRFPDLNNDVTLRLFYSQSQSGPEVSLPVGPRE